MNPQQDQGVIWFRRGSPGFRVAIANDEGFLRQLVRQPTAQTRLSKLSERASHHDSCMGLVERRASGNPAVAEQGWGFYKWRGRGPQRAIEVQQAPAKRVECVHARMSLALPDPNRWVALQSQATATRYSPSINREQHVLGIERRGAKWAKWATHGAVFAACH